MAPAASEEEQDKEVEIVPAAPDPDCERQQERDVTVHQDHYKKLLSELQLLRARISLLLGPASPHRVVLTDDYGRRFLAFLEKELSVLTTVILQHLDDAEMKAWPEPSVVRDLLLVDDLRGVDPSRHHKLLRRVSQCFHHRKSFFTPYYATVISKAGALPLVGIDRPAKKILRWLTHSGKIDSRGQLRVITIVGPMGIGKTTLALELHNRIRQHETNGGHYCFQCNAMAKASRGVDRNILLLRDILSQVSEPAATTQSSDLSEAKTTEILVRLVSEYLRDKRYFIIIDDICEASHWEEIKGAFPDTNNLGSRILITTQVTSIAEACSCSSYDGLVHKMKPLNQMDSQRLLLAKTVGSVHGCLPDNIKLCCNEILSRSDGIPLFIAGIADWLIKEQLQQRQQQPVDQDEEGKEISNFFAIGNKEISICCEGQVPQLPQWLEQTLSYAFINDFPNNQLWPLLLYMSMFPYGYKFDKHRLLGKWIIEGLVEMLDAETLFSQLVDGNVITSVAANYCKHNTNGNEAEACQWQVNHFMHQFLASKSAEIGFIFTTTALNLLAAAAEEDRGNQTSSRMPRRLALHHPDPLLPSLLETMDLSQTRSLAVSGTVSGIPMDKFVNLVLLDLEGWENLKDEDLLQLCRIKMVFLRYLRVRNTRVSRLLHEIKELRDLEQLDVSYTQISELPLELFELTNLEQLDLRGTWISLLPKQIVGLQGCLHHLLVGGEGMVNSVETAAMVTHDVRRLDRLQTLATVDLTEQPASFVRALGDLRDLVVLAVIWSFRQSTDRDYCEALLSSIAKWMTLESLTIHCGLGCSMEFLGSLEKSCAPHRLEKFKVIVGRFSSVPQWIDGLYCLAFVQITVCNKQTTTDDLKILGAIPRLRCLILGLDFIPAQAIEIENQGFHELQRFSVDCPMPWLTFNTGATQKLTYLQLEFCSTPVRQICVPSGISNLRRLTEVALCYNKQYNNSPSIKKTVQAVTKQVAEHSNPIDLFINGIEQDDVQEVVDQVIEITIGTSSRTNAGAEDDAQAVGEEATAAVQCEITEAES